MLEEITLQNELTGYKVVLKQMQEEDQELIREWRNNKDIRRFMISQDEISREQHSAWFSRMRDDDRQQHFVIYYKGCAIGSINLKARYQAETLVRASAIEPGLYIAAQKYKNNILAFAPSLLIIDYCFYYLHAKQLKAVVKADNEAALNYNYALGYENCENSTNQPTDLIEIILEKDKYERKVANIKQLLSR